MDFRGSRNTRLRISSGICTSELLVWKVLLVALRSSLSGGYS